MLKTNITYHRAKTPEELKAILELQQQNLRESLSEKQKEKEGFVTIKHNFNILKKMNDAYPHCIAKDNGIVVGYALCMLKEFKKDIPFIIPMLKEVNTFLKAENRKVNYIVMGQVCISKNKRGKGVFRGLYNFMAQELKKDFNAIITEASVKNKRSLNAHKAIGFKVLKTHTSNNQKWEIISLEI